jgi:hypothetical protein
MEGVHFLVTFYLYCTTCIPLSYLLHQISYIPEGKGLRGNFYLLYFVRLITVQIHPKRGKGGVQTPSNSAHVTTCFLKN